MDFLSFLKIFNQMNNAARKNLSIDTVQNTQMRNIYHLWMVVELMSFGQLVTFYRNQDILIKKGLAGQFNLFPPVLDFLVINPEPYPQCLRPSFTIMEPASAVTHQISG